MRTCLTFLCSAFLLGSFARADILVGDFNDDTIRRFDDAGNLLGTFADATDGILATYDMVRDSAGRIYLANGSNILRFEEDGTPLGVFADVSALNLVIDSAGNLYYLTSTREVHKISPSGVNLGRIITEAGALSLRGMAIDANDRLYLPLDYSSGSSSTDVIRVYETDGTLVGNFGQATEADGNLLNPRDPGIGPDGNLYVSSGVNNIFSPAGLPLGQLGSPQPVKNIAFDAFGNIYGTDGSEDDIYQYDSNGNYLGTIIAANEGGLSADFRPEAILFLQEGPEPGEIALEQPPSTPLTEGGGRSFGGVEEGASSDLSFRILNGGASPLAGVTVSLSGPDAAQLQVQTPPASDIAVGANAGFSIRFSPSGPIGPRHTTLTVNSSLGIPYTVQLVGELEFPAENLVPVGDVNGGTVTAGNGEGLDIGEAIGGTIDATAGTAFLTTLDGATLQVGSLGALIENLESGLVDANGNVTIDNLNDGDVELAQLAYLYAKQGTYLGTLSGEGTLAKIGDGTLTVSLQNSFNGKVGIWGGILQIAALGDLGVVPIIVLNNGRFRILADIDLGTGVVQAEDGTVYEKVFSPGEPISNLGCLQNGNTCMRIGAGNAGSATSLEAAWLDDVLTIDGLDGTSFLLLMNTDIPGFLNDEDVYIGWKDPLDEEWKRAGVGNHGPNGIHSGFHSGTYQQFLADKGGWDPTTMLGAYGTDLGTGEVWAVVDHNSEFGIRGIPEDAVVAQPALEVHAGASVADPQLFNGQSAFVDMGTTTVGNPVIQEFTIENEGDAVLNVSSVTVPTQFTLLDAPTSIAAGLTHVFRVRYDAPAAGIHLGAVTIHSDDSLEDPFVFPIRAAVAPAYVDTDGDGISDAFEDAFTLNKNDPADAGFDDDHDGLSSLYEFALYGNPNDATDIGVVRIVLTDTDVDLDSEEEFTLLMAVRRGLALLAEPNGGQAGSVHGVRYEVEGSDELSSFQRVVAASAPRDKPPLGLGLPDLTGTAWEYRFFSLENSNSLPGSGFMKWTLEDATP